MELSILLDLGLSVNEARVYLALLDLGSSSVNEITKKSGVHGLMYMISLSVYNLKV